MKKPNTHPTYETNPITLLIESAKRAFNSAQGVALYLILIPIGLSFVQFIFQTFGQVFGTIFSEDSSQTVPAATLIIGLVLMLLAFVFAVFINVSWTGFSAAAGLAILNQKNEKFGVLFSTVLEKFIRVLGIIILIFLYSLPWWIAAASALISAIVGGFAGGRTALILIPLSSIATLFFALMAVRVNLRYALSTYALFDDKDQVLASMHESRELTKGRLAEVFGITSIGSIVPFLSALLVSGGNALLYGQLKSHRGMKKTLPRPHILNYLVLFLVLVFVVFVGAIILTVFLISRS